MLEALYVKANQGRHFTHMHEAPFYHNSAHLERYSLDS